MRNPYEPVDVWATPVLNFQPSRQWVDSWLLFSSVKGGWRVAQLQTGGWATSDCPSEICRWAAVAGPMAESVLGLSEANWCRWAQPQVIIQVGCWWFFDEGKASCGEKGYPNFENYTHLLELDGKLYRVRLNIWWKKHDFQRRFSSSKTILNQSMCCETMVFTRQENILYQFHRLRPVFSNMFLVRRSYL